MTTTETPLHIRQAEGLEKLAAMLRENPDLAKYLDASLNYGINAHVPYGMPKAEASKEFVAMVRNSPHAKLDKDWTEEQRFPVADFGAVTVKLLVWAEEVCQQVGTKTVTKTVKDPEALKAVPEIEVTEEVPVWECKPLLAAGTDAEVAV